MPSLPPNRRHGAPQLGLMFPKMGPMSRLLSTHCPLPCSFCAALARDSPEQADKSPWIWHHALLLTKLEVCPCPSLADLRAPMVPAPFLPLAVL